MYALKVLSCFGYKRKPSWPEYGKSEDGISKLPSGVTIRIWKNNSLKLDKHLKI